ncbi:MAG: hypothetical protein M1823_004758 [Watsoniomyces obsoletus]|nr:MAG: hypothetical protein M1823_004758 [Watsoniomyces obsoletus]
MTLGMLSISRHSQASISTLHIFSNSASRVSLQLFDLSATARPYRPAIVVTRRQLSRSTSHPLRSLRVLGGNMSLSNAKIISREPLREEEARWTKLVKTTFTDPNGKTRNWESAERRTRPAGSEVDGVGIVAILLKSEGPEIILQKQYRPPVGKVCIEVPAGLIDEGESVGTCALRELKEETGYVGELASGPSAISPLMFNDPGFCNTNLHLVHVTIDMDRPENREVKPELEENEFIEVFTVPLRNLLEECRRLDDEGYAIDARVGTLAEGIELASKWKLF